MDVFAPAKLILEYGYAGLCVLLVGVIVWMTRQLLAALRANQQVISANTKAIQGLRGTTDEVRVQVRQLRDDAKEGCPFFAHSTSAFPG